MIEPSVFEPLKFYCIRFWVTFLLSLFWNWTPLRDTIQAYCPVIIDHNSRLISMVQYCQFTFDPCLIFKDARLKGNKRCNFTLLFVPTSGSSTNQLRCTKRRLNMVSMDLTVWNSCLTGNMILGSLTFQRVRVSWNKEGLYCEVGDKLSRQLKAVVQRKRDLAIMRLSGLIEGKWSLSCFNVRII